MQQGLSNSTIPAKCQDKEKRRPNKQRIKQPKILDVGEDYVFNYCPKLWGRKMEILQQTKS